jgi:hypothetical protein
VGLNDIGKCALCQTDGVELRKSHILPEFCYSHIYDDDHKMIVFDPSNPDRQWTEQKGTWERLLCESCEQFLNKHFELPFKKSWIDAKVMSRLNGKRSGSA